MLGFRGRAGDEGVALVSVGTVSWLFCWSDPLRAIVPLRTGVEAGCSDDFFTSNLLISVDSVAPWIKK